MPEVSTGKVLKIDETLKTVFGWASVIEENGLTVVDRQGDMISEPTLQKAVHGYIMDERAGKVMHKGKRVADVVESLVMTKDLQKALGIDLNKSGWLIGMKIRDEELWKQVKSGDFPTFSIGGQGQRVPVEGQ